MERPVFRSQFCLFACYEVTLTRANILGIWGPAAWPPCWARILSLPAAPSCTPGSQHSQPWWLLPQPSGFPLPGHFLITTCFLPFWFTSSTWLSYPWCHQKPLRSLTKLQGNPRMIETGSCLINWICFPNSIAGSSRARIMPLLCDQTEYTCVLSLRLERFTEGLNLQGYSDIASNRLPETKDSEQETAVLRKKPQTL